MVSTNIARCHNSSPPLGLIWDHGRGALIIPQETSPTAERPWGQRSPSRPLPWSLQGSGDQVYLPRTSCRRIYCQHTRGSPTLQTEEGDTWAEFGLRQPLESPSAWKCLSQRKMEDQGFGLLSTVIKPLGPTCEEWVFVPKRLTEEKGAGRTGSQRVKCGFGKRLVLKRCGGSRWRVMPSWERTEHQGKNKKQWRDGRTEKPSRGCIISPLGPNAPVSYIVMHIIGPPQRFVINSAIK